MFNNKSGDADYIYYNGNIIPDLTNTVHQHGQIVFNDSLIDNLIDNANKYEFAIDRVQFDASLLPVWIPLLDSTINDGTTTVYSVNIYIDDSNLTASFTVPIMYNNDDYIINHSSNPNDHFNNPYYWINSMQRFVDLLNATITACFNIVVAQIASVGGSFTGACPFVMFDTNTELFSVYFDSTALPNIVGKQLKLTFNNHLQLLMRHFNYKQVNLNDDIGFQFYPTNNFGTNTYIYNSITYVYVTQENKSIEYFCPVSSIVFSSDQLPIVGDITSNAKTITDSLYALSSIGAQERIITDIVVGMNSLYDYKQIITYIPTQYRWISMVGTDVKKINLSVYWRNKYNASLYPIYISAIGFCSFKFVFKKRI